MAVKLDGKAVSLAVQAEIAEEVKVLAENGLVPERCFPGSMPGGA